VRAAVGSAPEGPGLARAVAAALARDGAT
jgi:hypothetical protein